MLIALLAYMGGMLEMCSARLYGYWAHLTEALGTGEPQNEAKRGGDIFDALYKDGVLHVTLPKKVSAKSQAVAVKVK